MQGKMDLEKTKLAAASVALQYKAWFERASQISTLLNTEHAGKKITYRVHDGEEPHRGIFACCVPRQSDIMVEVIRLDDDGYPDEKIMLGSIRIDQIESFGDIPKKKAESTVGAVASLIVAQTSVKDSPAIAATEKP